MTEQAPSPQGILWLKLSEESKQKLQEACPPKYPNLYCDHITLAFDTPKDTATDFVGKNALASVFAYACNDKVEAVRVDTHGLPDTFGAPHVTLSTQNGIEPFESVAMLKDEHQEKPIDPPFEVNGHIEFIPFESAS